MKELSSDLVPPLVMTWVVAEFRFSLPSTSLIKPRPCKLEVRRLNDCVVKPATALKLCTPTCLLRVK
jgi:hypothetical protein